MCVYINKAFNVLCSQSLCEVVVNCCRRGVGVKVVVRVWSCRVAVFGIVLLPLLSSLLY